MDSEFYDKLLQSDSDAKLIGRILSSPPYSSCHSGSEALFQPDPPLSFWSALAPLLGSRWAKPCLFWIDKEQVNNELHVWPGRSSHQFLASR